MVRLPSFHGDPLEPPHANPTGINLVQRRLRYIIEGSAVAAAVGWLAVEVAQPTQLGFAPPVSSLHWSWSDLAVRSSPSMKAHEIAQIETGESVQVIRRPDGWAAVIDTVVTGIVGFVPDSALHLQRLPTFAMVYSHVSAVLDSLRTDSLWVALEDPSRLRHVSNGRFEVAGTFTARPGEPVGRQYRLLLQYTGDNGWEPVLSLTIEHVAY